MTPALAPFLSPFAAIYWIGLKLDRFFSRSHALPVPVISVGNITVGGTGKTPLLIYIANFFLARSKTPAVLTRGYKSLTDGENDEALLVKRRCEGVVLVSDPNRWSAANKLLKRSTPDVFILDDGLQHWPLKRNLDLVCIDATDPWGGGWLLPAGRLREPCSALRRANLIVVNRSELVDIQALARLKTDLARFAPNVPVVSSICEYELLQGIGEEPAPMELLRLRPVIALSAIGHPAAFEAVLLKYGAIVEPRRFSDHHAYNSSELKAIRERARGSGALIVVTEKDWVKIASALTDYSGFYVLRQSLTFSAEDGARLHALLERGQSEKNQTSA
jgi:tetraacyldisaccharide 4'-kinase